MPRKIVAEFESVDMADRTAREIRQIEGVRSIQVYCSKNILDTVGSYYSVPHGYTNSLFLSGGLDDLDPGMETNYRRQSHVVVVAENTARARVEQKLINLGGLGVHSQSHI